MLVNSNLIIMNMTIKIIILIRRTGIKGQTENLKVVRSQRILQGLGLVQAAMTERWP